MNIENHQAVGNPYPASWEGGQQTETVDQFKLWLEGADSEALYFEAFLEKWHPLELFGWMQNGTLQTEFNKYHMASLKEDFEASEGEQISVKEVMEVTA
jgi:hypothetical protein